MGQGTYGVASASLEYFNKSVKELNYNEAALLAALPKAPSKYNPYKSKLLAKTRRNLVLKNLEENNIFSKDIRIKLLCYPRIFGYVFNPLSVFFVYDYNENLISILYEVKNTFGEQHTYIFRVEKNNMLQHNCFKKFHVSPFIEMNCNYFFRILKPSEKISVIIDQYQQNEKILFASQEGKRVDFTTIELLKSYIKHPLMTFKIISAIHFEAFKLWLKGIKFVKKKLKIKNNITFEN